MRLSLQLATHAGFNHHSREFRSLVKSAITHCSLKASFIVSAKKMQGDTLLSTLTVILMVSQQTTCLTHTRTLMWTVKSVVDGSVDVRGVPGDPEDWVLGGIREWAISYFTDSFSRSVSRRVALAFQYSTRRVFFNDKGFKEIFRITLQVAPYTPYTYDVNLEVVYGGISTEVNGLAMDWASGSIYWTDALYNWITVANASDYGVSKHIIHTGFSRPMGLAVYPKRGQLFWSVVGAVPKIERSTLEGADRMNFIDSDLDRPLGLSIDYKADHLYWVDDLRDTIERVNLSNPTDRWTIHVGYRHSTNAKLFGLAVYNDYIFATDQVLMGINVFNKTTGSLIREFTAVIFDNIPKGIPYDIQMYDASIQEEIDSDCNRLGCSDMCISDGGQSAHCICQEGYIMSSDQRTCFVDQSFRMPQYLYSVGSNLCGTDVIAADQEYVPTDVKCFYNVSGHEMVALGFDAYANFLFFSDSKDNVIHRMLLTNDVNESSVDVITANTGFVSGLAIDWIADNLYWTDRDRGVIMVSRLTGRYPMILIKDIDHPASIAVNPLNGTMYWATPDKIYMANMDGTGVRVLINLPGSKFDGMVLDIRRDLLYWVDQSLPGIRSCHMNGSGLMIVIQADVSKGARTFRDVTVYESYIAWTDGMQTVYFGVTSPDNSTLVSILRGLLHVEEKTSHDIITYDYYLQPLLDPGEINPCDIDNDVHGCDQLCLLTPNGRQCRCGAGFHLVNDSRCVSDPLYDNFLLFIDPYHKNAYQFDLLPSSSDGSGPDRLRGIALQSANEPSLVTFDLRSQNLFWFDEDRLKNSIKLISIKETVHYHILSTLSKDVQMDRLDAFDDTGALLYIDSSVGSIFIVDVATGDLRRMPRPRNVYGSAFAVNEITGYIYWVDRVTRIIYKCHVTSSCSNESSDSIVLSSWTGNKIVGLNVALNVEMNLILWTDRSVYSVENGSAIQIFSADDSVILTSVVLIGKIIYYTSWTGNAVFQYDVEKKKGGITVEGFSRITDLKGYCSKCYSMPWTAPTPEAVAVATGGGGIGAGPIAGIVVGSLFFLLLLLLLLILIVVLLRRRREKRTTPATVAYTNETYDRLSSVVASLSRFPEGAQGINPYDFYDDDGAGGVGGGEKKGKKERKGLPEIFADDPPLYFADDSTAGATGYDYFAKGGEQFEEKNGPPFPEVCAGDLPVFKIDGGGGLVNAKGQQDLLSQYGADPTTGVLPTYEDLENNNVTSSTHI